VKTQVEGMLQKGVIRESNSPWCAPALLVPKKVPMEKQNLGFVLIFEP
jgi:hypothetical protein